MKKLALLFLALTVAATAFAQDNDYIIQIGSGKKILNAANVPLPPTTPLEDLLQMFPELLARDWTTIMNNYEVQIADVSIGIGKENILRQYRLSDIKKIEVSAKPATSVQNNGQGGVINIFLKDVDEGVSGSALLSLNSSFLTQPGVVVNYSKNKWIIRSSLYLEYAKPYNEVKIRETINPGDFTYTTDSLDARKGYEMLNIDALYNDGKNKLRLWARECMDFAKTDARSAVEKNSVIKNESYDERQYNFDWVVGGKWEHKFTKSIFETQFYFTGAPSEYGKNKYDNLAGKNFNYWNLKSADNSFTITGYAKYKYNFIPSTPTAKRMLNIGVNSSYSPSRFGYDFSCIPSNISLPGQESPQAEVLSCNYSTFYLSPYIESDNIFDIWLLKAGIRFQHYDTYIKEDDVEGNTKSENYFTAFINFGCQIAPHHHLSLILDRSVNRVSSYMTYPFTVYLPSSGYFSTGNPNLSPVSVHDASLNYITDFKVNENIFTIDGELKYINNDKLVYAVRDEESIKYSNDGTSNIYAANLMFVYSYRIFSLAFTANYFMNNSVLGGNHDIYNYYNLSLSPALNFGDGWSLAMQFMYNSHIYTQYSKLSDYFYTNTRVSKSWDKWTVFLDMNDNFHDYAVDEIYGKAVSETLYYNLHRPSLEIGCHFKF